jgi:hypothetical protein
MSIDQAIQQMIDTVKAACKEAVIKSVKMFDDEARISVYAPGGDIQINFYGYLFVRPCLRPRRGYTDHQRRGFLTRARPAEQPGIRRAGLCV